MVGMWDGRSEGVMQTFKIAATVQTSPGLIESAVDCSVLNGILVWDALIVARAAASGCVVLYSEDLNPGQTIQGVRIENPFAQGGAGRAAGAAPACRRDGDGVC
jgi:predicted nucleic acid-binding protein